MQRRPVAGAPALARRATSEASASYFASGSDKTNLQFVSSGCALMDEALGGGYALGRVANVVGDKSSGKTLKAMEMLANFLLRYPKGWARYAEAEAAFDNDYAAALGIPVDRIIMNAKGAPMATVEEWYEDLKGLLESKDGPGIYILDSLDALSDGAELDAEFDAASYGGTKPKQIGKLFRLLVAELEAKDVLLVIVSQLRDKLNVSYGETKTRSGGKALDYYASHIVWLREVEKLKRTISGVERVVGLGVEAYVKKNKVGLPFRKAQYPILFGYGIDDMTASAEWLLEVGREKRLHELGMKKGAASRAKTKAGVEKAQEEAAKVAHLKPYKDFIEEVRNRGGATARDLRAALASAVHEEWQRIETGFLPRATKY